MKGDTIMQRFTNPRDIYFGANAIDHLKTIEGKKAIIVIGSDRLIEDGTIGKIQDNLKVNNIESIVFGGVEVDPTVETVKRGAEAMIEYQPDWIISVGGGSPIDAAKAMWIFYEYPDFTFEEAAKPFNLPELRQKAKFIAVSTTSGTGTEVTAFSIIADEKTGTKYPIADFNITPDIAILDTNLVKGLTPTLIANTGMDAITHSFEAYVSTAANPMTDAMAINSIEMIVENLVKSYNGDLEAGAEMHIAQCMAGIAFSNAVLGIVHSMAHKTGKIFSVPHGMANAIYLPYVIRYNQKNASKRYAEIAKRLGLKGNTEAELVDSLVDLVWDIKGKMNMPKTLQEYGVDEKEFLDKLTYISEGAIQDACTGTNPRPIDAKTMERLFKATYYGEEVNF